MNEGTLKSALREALVAEMPGAVVISHISAFPSGTPDRSVTWGGHTSWIEVKYSRPGRRAKATPLQQGVLTELATAGAPAYLVEYREPTRRRQRSAAAVRTVEVNRVLSGGCYRSEVIGGGRHFDQHAVAKLIKAEHQRRRG